MLGPWSQGSPYQVVLCIVPNSDSGSYIDIGDGGSDCIGIRRLMLPPEGVNPVCTYRIVRSYQQELLVGIPILLLRFRKDRPVVQTLRFYQ